MCLLSVTTHEILKLPALKGAKVIAGAAALDKIVGSVSVLEYSQPTMVQNEILQHINFNHDEIVLTAFASIKNDITAQCRNIELLATAGEIGIILFYVGLIVPTIDPRVIATAEQHDFLLLCMPKNEPNITYSSVITEIMFAVFNDQVANPNFAPLLIKKISTMPDYQQNMDMVLRLISDRIHASLALLNDRDKVVVAQNWPQTNHLNWTKLRQLMNRKRQTIPDLIQFDLDKTKSKLLIYKEQGNLNHIAQEQAIETVQIGLNLWGDLNTTPNLADLLEAIIQNEPQKQFELAKQYQIDLKQLTSLLIINNSDQSIGRITQIKTDMVQIAASFTATIFCETYGNELFIFPLIPVSDFQSWDRWQKAISQYGHEHGVALTSTRFVSLAQPSKIRAAYIKNRDTLAITKIIFPHKDYFSEQDLIFAHSCQQLINRDDYKSRLYKLEQLSADLLKTLLAFCLDAKENIEQTAKQLYIHPNTVKYRINKLNNQLGFRLGLMPESFAIYQLAGVFRLVHGDLV